jgi:hypothetical protein
MQDIDLHKQEHVSHLPNFPIISGEATINMRLLKLSTHPFTNRKPKTNPLRHLPIVEGLPAAQPPTQRHPEHRDLSNAMPDVTHCRSDALLLIFYGAPAGRVVQPISCRHRR